MYTIIERIKGARTEFSLLLLRSRLVFSIPMTEGECRGRQWKMRTRDRRLFPFTVLAPRSLMVMGVGYNVLTSRSKESRWIVFQTLVHCDVVSYLSRQFLLKI